MSFLASLPPHGPARDAAILGAIATGNLDAPDWPIKGKSETPATYIDLNFEEVVELLQLKGQKPERIDQLVGILKETLAFDSPFGEMVTQSEASAVRENQLLKNLAKLVQRVHSFPEVDNFDEAAVAII